MNRGDVYDVDWPGLGQRPVVVITRDRAIPYLSSITVALVTTRVRGLPTEAQLAGDGGLVEGSVANCDNLLTVSKTALGRRRRALDPDESHALDSALAIALGLD